MIYHQKKRVACLRWGPLAGHMCVVRSKLLGDLMLISGINMEHLSENTRPLTGGVTLSKTDKHERLKTFQATELGRVLVRAFCVIGPTTNT